MKPTEGNVTASSQYFCWAVLLSLGQSPTGYSACLTARSHCGHESPSAPRNTSRNLPFQFIMQPLFFFNLSAQWPFLFEVIWSDKSAFWSVECMSTLCLNCGKLISVLLLSMSAGNLKGYFTQNENFTNLKGGRGDILRSSTEVYYARGFQRKKKKKKKTSEDKHNMSACSIYVWCVCGRSEGQFVAMKQFFEPIFWLHFVVHFGTSALSGATDSVFDSWPCSTSSIWCPLQ